MDKICIISNEPFCYLLKVDGVEIPFQSSSSVEYLAKHYQELGYEIKLEDNYK